MKRIINIFILILLFSQFSTSQIISKSAQVLVRGIITDLIDNTPMPVEIRFEDPSGKFFKINSNSLTGKFEQILSSNTQYKVRLFANNIFPTEFILITPDVKNYTEVEQNYSVIRLDVGRTALIYDIFAESKHDFIQEYNKIIDELNLKMRFNRNVKVKLEINGLDSKANFLKITEKKVKKKTITETTFNKIAYEDMINKRFKALNEIVSKFTYSDRITIGYNLSLELSDNLLKDCPNCDIRVIVAEFDPTLK